MKLKTMLVVLLVASVVALGGCQKAESTSAVDIVAVEGAPYVEADGAAAQPLGGGDRPGGDVPNPGLDSVNLLTLGTFELEGSDNAVTSEQANELLPLWTLIQGGTVTNDAEIQAVIKQIESVMTEAQLAAIDAMGLTMEDMLAWMQEQGIEIAATEMGAPEDAPTEGQGGPGGMANMTEEERAQMREQFQNMTEEERATAMEEGGFARPEGAPDGQGQPPGDGQRPSGGRGGMRGGNSAMLEPLISLLTERAAQ